MENPLIDIFGWIGSILLIVAYWLVSKKKLEPESFLYHGFNILGSIMLIVNTCYYGAFPSTAVNVIWVFIGSFYIMKYRKEWEQGS